MRCQSFSSVLLERYGVDFGPILCVSRENTLSCIYNGITTPFVAPWQMNVDSRRPFRWQKGMELHLSSCTQKGNLSSGIGLYLLNKPMDVQIYLKQPIKKNSGKYTKPAPSPGHRCLEGGPK
jgi:hypothetical protein